MKRLGAFFLALSCLSICGCQKSFIKGTGPNIVVILIDALRPDRLHDYGSPRKTNPFLTEFGKQGIRFTNAYSHSSHTKISVASLFTGLIPPLHGVRNVDFPWGEDKTRYTSDILSSTLTTIAEVLLKKGYRTAAYVTNPYLKNYFGFSQGFEDYKYIDLPQGAAKSLNTEVINWLKRPRAGPFFLYIHYMDIHAPYRPPLPYRFLYTPKKIFQPYGSNGPYQGQVTEEAVQYTRDRYDAQINYWDDCFKEFIQEMEREGWADNTAFIILADHGEEFYDHGGFGHGFTLYEDQLRIPLYIVFKGRIPPAQVRKDRVEIIDIFPTICALAGLSVRSLGLQGRNVLASKRLSPDAFHYAETSQGKLPASVQTEKYKLIFNIADKSFELYDLTKDAREFTNIICQKTAWARAGQKELFRLISLRRSGVRPSKRELDRGTIEALRSLGYIK